MLRRVYQLCDGEYAVWFSVEHFFAEIVKTSDTHKHYYLRTRGFHIAVLSLALAAAFTQPTVTMAGTCDAQEPESLLSEHRECRTLAAVKTNLLYDAALTPDMEFELSFGHHFSVCAGGVYAWWSRESKHHYWRLRGCWAEGRYWLGRQEGERRLSGHHFGIYADFCDFDFEFGGTGVQSPRGTYGCGVSYGYSFPLNSRLNLDLSLRLGYQSGKIVKYKPECGVYVCTDSYTLRYFGPTSLEITLVWFPGSRNANKP